MGSLPTRLALGERCSGLFEQTNQVPQLRTGQMPQQLPVQLTDRPIHLRQQCQGPAGDLDVIP